MGMNIIQGEIPVLKMEQELSIEFEFEFKIVAYFIVLKMRQRISRQKKGGKFPCHPCPTM